VTPFSRFKLKVFDIGPAAPRNTAFRRPRAAAGRADPRKKGRIAHAAQCISHQRLESEPGARRPFCRKRRRAARQVPAADAEHAVPRAAGPAQAEHARKKTVLVFRRRTCLAQTTCGHARRAAAVSRFKAQMRSTSPGPGSGTRCSATGCPARCTPNSSALASGGKRPPHKGRSRNALRQRLAHGGRFTIYVVGHAPPPRKRQPGAARNTLFDRRPQPKGGRGFVPRPLAGLAGVFGAVGV